MDAWHIILELLLMLAAALVLGALAERFRQSAVLGYLVAGTLIGPNVLGLVSRGDHVSAIAEMGVSLLLFAIGLEFSFRRLMRLGRVALVGGSAQVLVTLLVAALAAGLLGLDARGAVAVGAMVALSSTACVLRLMLDRGVVDSLYGRSVLGVLLLQDLAVIPLMLLVVILSGGGTAAGAALMLGKSLLLGLALVASFWVVIGLIVPRLLGSDQWMRNRDLPILLAIVIALGSAYAAHAASLSPAIGAFVAGVLLGESPFATQVRADVGSLRTLLVTVFFASIGMLGDPAWAVANGLLVSGTVVFLVLGKALVVWGVLRTLGLSSGIAAAAGLCLAQVGEFSFLLAEVAHSEGGIISDDVFNLMVTSTIVTLFLTPFLIGGAPRVAAWIESRRRTPGGATDADVAADVGGADAGPIFIIGFGPAGRAVAEALFRQHRERISVIEMNPRTAASARHYDLPVHLGDACHHDVLEHAGVARAAVIAITIPDPVAATTVVRVCRAVAPDAAIVVRSRFHMSRWELQMAGANDVVDEEEQVGLRIAARCRKFAAVGPG